MIEAVVTENYDGSLTVERATSRLDEITQIPPKIWDAYWEAYEVLRQKENVIRMCMREQDRQRNYSLD